MQRHPPSEQAVSWLREKCLSRAARALPATDGTCSNVSRCILIGSLHANATSNELHGPSAGERVPFLVLLRILTRMTPSGPRHIVKQGAADPGVHRAERVIQQLDGRA